MIPLPKDPRHQRLADLTLTGEMSRAEAYGKIYPTSKKTSRNPAAAKILKRADVKAYIAAIRQHTTTDRTLTFQEKREFLARIVRTPITALSTDSEKNADLIKSYATSETEISNSTRLEKYDALKAIEIDNRLAGDEAETTLERELAAALAALKPSSPVPDDKM